MPVCPNLVQDEQDFVFADGDIGYAAHDELLVGTSDLPSIAVFIFLRSLAVPHTEHQRVGDGTGGGCCRFGRGDADTSNRKGLPQAVGAKEAPNPGGATQAILLQHVQPSSDV